MLFRCFMSSTCDMTVMPEVCKMADRSASLFFEQASGFPPLPFQLAALVQEPAPIRTLEAPTGLGKTLALLVSWLYQRQQRPDITPRRLVFQLPLRSLVDQIAAECRAVLARLDLPLPVCVLRGGQIEEAYLDDLASESVIIGTLDQVVSRQLMRGYCCSRWSWPRHFAALNTDVRVVVDETQLQGAALQTALCLQQLHMELGGPRPRELVLVSATFDPALLSPQTPRQGLTDADHAHPVALRKIGQHKSLELAGAADITALVRERHQPDTLTLVVLNRVATAQAVYAALSQERNELLLLHSRFRRADRQARELALQGFTGIVIATQVVEAGIDLDARLLVTELCPWAAFVQRCGRVGRNGTYAEADVVVVTPTRPLPYDQTDLEATRQRLAALDNAGIRSLLAVAAPPQPLAGQRLDQRTLLRLYDTHPLPQGDDDISDYLRVGEQRDVSLLWRREPGGDMPAAHHLELCPVPQRALQQRFANVWTPQGDGWVEMPSARIPVGAVVCVPADAGGYNPLIGWEPAAIGSVPPIAVPVEARDYGDRSSFGVAVPVSLSQHLGDTQEEAEWLVERLHLDAQSGERLIRAAWLHDVGKAHPVFQATMRANGCPEGQWAKAPAWGSRHARPGFRHEVASALAALAWGEDPLVSYLLMSHHGKVRLRLDPFPWQERDGTTRHGITDAELLPAIPEVCSAVPLRLPSGKLGKGWDSLARRLLQTHGPFRLAWLEALIRQADSRASARWQNAPLSSP
jgi:CRISPR-associated endonuclease/helicase Cas3